MGFIYRHIIHPLLSFGIGKKAITNNPYLLQLIDTDESELIADELFRIGMAYHAGDWMLPKDMGKARAYFRKAAERGHAVAQTFMVMASMRYNDDHNDEALYWLQKAAEQGERQALYNLGISYHRGDVGGVIDIDKSNELFRRAAEADYQPACQRMASIYFNGEGVEKSIEIAKYWALLEFGHLPEESRKESILAQLIGPDDVTEGNRINHKKIIEEAAEAGERDAMNNLATGLYNTDEKEKAISLWHKSAALKHPDGMCNVARLYCSGDIRDYARAIELFEEASKSGNEHAFYGLAMIYYHGLGVDKDVKKAWEYLEKAVNKGDDESRYLLATMCLHNEMQGFIPDNVLVLRGMSYMEQAAMHNFQPAVDFINDRANHQ